MTFHRNRARPAPTPEGRVLEAVCHADDAKAPLTPRDLLKFDARAVRRLFENDLIVCGEDFRTGVRFTVVRPSSTARVLAPGADAKEPVAAHKGADKAQRPVAGSPTGEAKLRQS